MITIFFLNYNLWFLFSYLEENILQKCRFGKYWISNKLFCFCSSVYFEVTITVSIPTSIVTC